MLPDASAIVVDLRRMDQLLELNETALQVRVQAGMMGHTSRTRSTRAATRWAHWPQSIALSTVGGWVATRAAGQFSTRYGSIEDMLLGLEAVLADGRVVRIKATPRRSAGPDLRHLFLGAEGTLGIVTEVDAEGLSAAREPPAAELRVSRLRLPASKRSGTSCAPAGGRRCCGSTTRWRPAATSASGSSDDRCFLLLLVGGAGER